MLEILQSSVSRSVVKQFRTSDPSMSGHSIRFASGLIPIERECRAKYQLIMESDANYFRRRASEEYLAASCAAPALASRAHREIADRYAELASAIEAEERKLGTTVDEGFDGAAVVDLKHRATLWV